MNDAIDNLAPDPIAHIGRLLSRGTATAASAAPPPSTATTAHNEWCASGFLASLELPALLADALLAGRADSVPEVEHLKALDRPSVWRRLVGSSGDTSPLPVHSQLAEAVWTGLVALRGAVAVTGHELHTKFLAEPGAFELSFGGLSTFFAGLERLIGPPQPNLLESMRREHCASADSTLPFCSTSYGTRTTSIVEWTFVVRPEEGPEQLGEGHGLANGLLREWPTETLGRESCRRHPRPLADFDAERRAINAQLQSKDCPAVLEEELISARLYTGP